VRVDRSELLAIFVGGCLGAVARAALGVWLPHDPGHWSWSTFIANMAGTALLGWAATRLGERMPLSAYRRPLIGTGFCGGLTTFSTLQVELLQFADRGCTGPALAYAGSSLVAGFGVMWLSTGLARR
jgi:fluoride exporter